MFQIKHEGAWHGAGDGAPYLTLATLTPMIRNDPELRPTLTFVGVSLHITA